MNPQEEKSIFDSLVESMEYIAYLCKDVPDTLTKFPEEKNLSLLISVKSVANKTLGYTNMVEKSGRAIK